MSRSIGGSSLTTFSSIEICPEVMLSRPATMRKVVVLPQPDGPTSTTNSWSRMSRLTSMTAWTSSYFLLRLRIATRAMILSLYRPGDAGDVILDKERIDERDRDRAQQRTGHQLAPEEHVAAHQFRGDPDRHGLLLGRGEEDQRVDELVPRQGEGENPGRQDAWDRHREDDVEHRLPARRAVDPRAFLKLLGDRFEIPHQEPGAERDEEGWVGEDQRPGRIAEVEVADDVGERDEQQRLRHEIGDEDPGADAAGEREFEPRQRIAGEQAAKQRDRRRRQRDDHRVQHPGAEHDD